VARLQRRRFEETQDVRVTGRGQVEVVELDDRVVAKITWQPGWRWSVDVGRALRQTSCHVEHVGLVLSGCATAAMDDGSVHELRAGDLFHIPPGHDSWVVGDEPYVSLHFLGAEDYAAKDAGGGAE
jgi:mannose-6-phosphate isomerase-like protein (cupin superfamily)